MTLESSRRQPRPFCSETQIDGIGRLAFAAASDGAVVFAPLESGLLLPHRGDRQRGLVAALRSLGQAGRYVGTSSRPAMFPLGGGP